MIRVDQLLPMRVVGWPTTAHADERSIFTYLRLRLENLALRASTRMLRRSAPKHLKLTSADRIFWVWLRRVWGHWKSALMIVKPATVIAWHRKGFRLF
jgi:hypothetical protein